MMKKISKAIEWWCFHKWADLFKKKKTATEEEIQRSISGFAINLKGFLPSALFANPDPKIRLHIDWKKGSHGTCKWEDDKELDLYQLIFEATVSGGGLLYDMRLNEEIIAHVLQEMQDMKPILPGFTWENKTTLVYDLEN